MTRTSARFPWKDGQPPHLPCGPGDVAEDVLVPGDPDRVALLADMLTDVVNHGRRREFALLTGTYEGRRVTICSTGIGGPSTEIALVELAALGARRAIRIGGMGALVPHLAPGTYVSVTRAIGDTGTAGLYRRLGGKAVATPMLADALTRAAGALGLVCTAGVVASTDSYYLGQDRPFRADDERDAAAPTLDRFRAAGAIGAEMECETVLTVCGVLGLEAACLLAIHGNRSSDSWLDDYESTQRNLLRIAGRGLGLATRSEGEFQDEHSRS